MNLSYRQYAKRRSVSEGAVRKAVKSGRITPEDGGLIDPEKADIQWRNNTDPSKRRKKKSNRKKKVPRAAMVALDDTVSEYGLDSLNDIYMRAKTANEVLKAEIGKIELRIMKGELIDRKTAVAQVFKLARSERDAWLNWPARVSAEYAAELGVDEHKFFIALSKSVRRHQFKIAGKG